MSLPVIAGVDGSAQSTAAAHWAAREAVRRAAPLRLLHVWPWLPHMVPGIPSPTLLQVETRRMLAGVRSDIQAQHPALSVETELLMLSEPDALIEAGRDAQMLVLGSRGLGGFRGLMVGSTGLATAARSSCPVVLVRSGERSVDDYPTEGETTSAPPSPRPVVLGLDARHPSDALLDFAVQAAAEHATSLHVVHAWGLPPLWSVNPMHLGDPERAQMEDQERQLLDDALDGRQQKFPEVDIRPEVHLGSAAQVLVGEADRAGLVVVGRHLRRPALGLRLGPVAHAVIHHAPCPVAVVPHE